jgi:hypothetical protein
VHVLLGMDTFNPSQHVWGLQELQQGIRLLKAAQSEHSERLTQHSERLTRLEQRQDESRIRSLWSSPSPFPPMLSSNSFTQRRLTFQGFLSGLSALAPINFIG